MGDVGARHEQRGGGGGSVRPRNGSTRGHTHAHDAFLARAAHLAKVTAEADGEVGGGEGGGRDVARDVGRRAGAIGELRDARSGACERGASRQWVAAAGGMRRIGPEFEP